MHSGAYHLSGHFPAERAWGGGDAARTGAGPSASPTPWGHRGGAHGVVAVICSQGLGEAKVADLGVVPVDQQDVAGRQVAVHKVLLFQVLHAHGHLVQQLGHVADGDLLPGVQGKAGQLGGDRPSSQKAKPRSLTQLSVGWSTMCSTGTY